MRRYAAVTIDEHWEQQLKLLEAKVWWECDDHYFEAWARRHGIDRTAPIGTAVDVLYLLGARPELPMLGAILFEKPFPQMTGKAPIANHRAGWMAGWASGRRPCPAAPRSAGADRSIDHSAQ